MEDKIQEYFEKNILPICVKINMFLEKEKVDYFHTMLALAALLGKHLSEIDRTSEISYDLSNLIEINIEAILDKQTRENN